MGRPRKVISSDDVEIQHDPNVSLAPPELAPPFDIDDIEIVDNEADVNYHKQLRNKAKREAIKFGNQLITIIVETDSNPDAASFVFAGHQGIKQYILRGVPQEVKRKYVCSFLAGKKVTVNAMYGKDNSGREFNTMNSSAAGTYRVTLVEDKHEGGGMKWFQQVMAQPA